MGLKPTILSMDPALVVGLDSKKPMGHIRAIKCPLHPLGKLFDEVNVDSVVWVESKQLFCSFFASLNPGFALNYHSKETRRVKASDVTETSKTATSSESRN